MLGNLIGTAAQGMSDSSLLRTLYFSCTFPPFERGSVGIPGDSFSGRVKVEPMSYKSISSYGIVGDLHTAALIALDGAVDWLCLPRFDSPSVFASILDEKQGGEFTIGPVSPAARSPATLPAGNQYPGHAFSHPGRSGGTHRFHALTRDRERAAQFAVGSPGESGERNAIPATALCSGAELCAGRS